MATRTTGAVQKLGGSFDFILSTVTADLPWMDYVNALRPYGKLCFVGVPPSLLSLPVFPLVRRLLRPALVDDVRPARTARPRGARGILRAG